VITSSNTALLTIPDIIVPYRKDKESKAGVFSIKETGDADVGTKKLPSVGSTEISISRTISLADVIKRVTGGHSNPIPASEMAVIYDRLWKIYPSLRELSNQQQVSALGTADNQPEIHIIYNIREFPPKISFLKDELSRVKRDNLLQYLRLSCTRLENALSKK
jgi:hypothetical protein